MLQHIENGAYVEYVCSRAFISSTLFFIISGLLSTIRINKRGKRLTTVILIIFHNITALTVFLVELW